MSKILVLVFLLLILALVVVFVFEIGQFIFRYSIGKQLTRDELHLPDNDYGFWYGKIQEPLKSKHARD